MTSARHSSATPRWGSPPAIITCARRALGGRIELDPMSEPAFNAVVGADRYYTEEDDCFKQSWQCETMLINPAGGLVVEAWRRLTQGWSTGEIQRAIWIGFSVEQLCILADHSPHPDDFSKLTMRGRIDFLTLHPLRQVVGRDRDDLLLECGHVVRFSRKRAIAAVSRKRPLRCPRCIGTPEPAGAPSHGNYIVGLGIKPGLFEESFAGMGRISHGRLAGAWREAA